MGAVCVGWGLPAPPWWVRLGGLGAGDVRQKRGGTGTGGSGGHLCGGGAAAESIRQRHPAPGLFLSPQPGGRGGHGTRHFDEVFTDCSETGQPGAREGVAAAGGGQPEQKPHCLQPGASGGRAGRAAGGGGAGRPVLRVGKPTPSIMR